MKAEIPCTLKYLIHEYLAVLFPVSVLTVHYKNIWHHVLILACFSEVLVLIIFITLKKILVNSKTHFKPTQVCAGLILRTGR